MIGLSVTATVLLLAGLAIAAGVAWTYAPPARREWIEALLGAGLLAICLFDLVGGSNAPWLSVGFAIMGASGVIGPFASLWRTRKASKRAEPTA